MVLFLFLMHSCAMAQRSFTNLYYIFLWQEKLNSEASLDQNRSDLGDSEIRESDDLVSHLSS